MRLPSRPQKNSPIQCTIDTLAEEPLLMVSIATPSDEAPVEFRHRKDDDVGGSSVDHAVANGIAHQLGDRGYAELLHDGGAMRLDGLDADAEQG
jgi:hypothetical protein